MKKSSMFVAAFLIVFTFGFQVFSQWADDETSHPVFRLDLDEIAGATKDLDAYTPESKRSWMTYVIYDTWLLRAISTRAREDLKKRWKTPRAWKKIGDALDVLAAVAAKKLPLYKPHPNKYRFHDLADEKKLKSAFKEFSILIIHKIGFEEGPSNWLISKNQYGLPIQRYKDGIIWARNPTDDHPYCHIYHLSIVQDYAGGGTYGTSFASFSEEELAGCPTAAR